MTNTWVQFVKDYALKSNISFTEALKEMKNPEIKSLYNAVKSGGAVNGKEVKQFVNASYETKPKKVIGDFELDEELSNKVAKVYHNKTTGETTITHRGTAGITDWRNNLAYVTGNYESTDRYKKAKKAQKKVESKYGNDNLYTVGHSQGAIIARKVGKDSKQIIGVNPASLGEKALPNEYNVRTSNDLVSMLLPKGKRNIVIKFCAVFTYF